MIYDNKIYVFDNIILLKEQEYIKKIFLSNNFPWYYVNDITSLNVKSQNRFGFNHTFFKNEKDNSAFSNLISNIINNSCKKIKFNYSKIINARSFFQFPLNKNLKSFDTPHIDNDKKHLVILYYVLDNEADTIIFKEKWDNLNQNLPKKFNILKKIKPKQGRVVIFDGHYWHTAKQPKNNKRCVINCNLI